MRNHRDHGGFSCSDRLPATVPDNRFGSPFKCPDKIPGPRFASPNSPLPPKELDKLQECIESANDLLRTLGNPRDPDNLTALRLRFRALRGTLMRVDVSCGNGQETLLGVLHGAGRDYIRLSAVGEELFIPFKRICSILRDAVREGHDEENGPAHGSNTGHGQELSEIDRCLRRELVLHFGNVVACNPKLLEIFFGLPLLIKLLDYLGCHVLVRLDSPEPDEVRGKLCGSEEGEILVQEENQLRQINLSTVCFITISPK